MRMTYTCEYQLEKRKDFRPCFVFLSGNENPINPKENSFIKLSWKIPVTGILSGIGITLLFGFYWLYKMYLYMALPVFIFYRKLII